MQCWERRKFLTCKVIFPNPPRNPLGTIDNVDLHEETQPSCRPVGPPHYRSSATSRPVVEWTNSANTSRERHVGLRRLRDHSMNIEVVTQFERSPILYSTSHQWKCSDAPPLMTITLHSYEVAEILGVLHEELHILLLKYISYSNWALQVREIWLRTV